MKDNHSFRRWMSVPFSWIVSFFFLRRALFCFVHSHFGSVHLELILTSWRVSNIFDYSIPWWNGGGSGGGGRNNQLNRGLMYNESQSEFAERASELTKNSTHHPNGSRKGNL